MDPNVEYMQSKRLRASNLPDRYNFESGYNRLIYYYHDYFVYTLLRRRAFLFQAI